MIDKERSVRSVEHRECDRKDGRSEEAKDIRKEKASVKGRKETLMKVLFEYRA